MYPLNYGVNYLDDYGALIVVGDFIQNISPNVYNFSIQQHIPSAIINGRIYCRFRLEGDAYRYGGMTHKLKKVFNDKGISKSIRNKIPLICDNSGILWVPGLPVREGGKNSDKSDTVSITVFYSTDNKKNSRIYTVGENRPR